MLKKFFATVGTGFFMAAGAFAFEGNFFSMEITPHFSLANGTIKEYVIEEACTNTDHIESRLDWDIKNIPMLGADAHFFLLRKILYAGVRFNVAIPKSSGHMQDYDWLNFLYWTDDDPTELTNYSISDNKLTSFYNIGLRLGASIPLPISIRLTPFVSYEYDFISFAGYDGYYMYKTYNWEQYDLSGKVISYKQELNAFFLGLDVSTILIPKTTVAASILFSPYATSISCLDLHHIGKRAYLDKIQNTWQLKSSVSARYNISRHHSVGISAGIQYIPFCYGADYYARIDSDENLLTSYSKTGAQGGTSRFLWSVSLAYTFTL